MYYKKPYTYNKYESNIVGWFDDSPAEYNTARDIIVEDEEHICSGVMDLDGTYFYRKPEKIKIGYIK